MADQNTAASPASLWRRRWRLHPEQANTPATSLTKGRPKIIPIEQFIVQVAYPEGNHPARHRLGAAHPRTPSPWVLAKRSR